MDDLVRAMQDRAKKQLGLNHTMQEIFTRHFKLREEDKADVGYMAYGLMAVDVAVILVNMFQSVKQDRGALNIVRDLTFTLNANKFWQNSAPVLVPLLQASTNAASDALFAQADRATNEAYQQDDALLMGARAMPLEMFPMIAFLLGGAQLMQECSLALKRELAPYFLS